jgi:hypothetical protein
MPVVSLTGWGSSEPELLQSLRMTGLTGQSLQLSVPGQFEGLANNLRKPVGEAVEAFAGKEGSFGGC